MKQNTKEHLIEVATSVFAREGFATTSLRSIAKEAGVSPALVVHHFGSRENLVDECINRALGIWVAQKLDLSNYSLSEAIGQWQTALDQHGSKLHFFRQVLLAGGQPAQILFSRMVSEAKHMLNAQIAGGQVRELSDPESVALLMTLHGLAPLLLMEEVTQELGGSFLSPDIGQKVAAANLEIYRSGIYKSSEQSEKQKEKAGKK